ADGERGLQHVGDMDAGAHDAAHEAALQHAARPVLVAVHRDRRALRERGGVRRAEPRDEFRGEVDVHDPGDAEAPEEGAPVLRADSLMSTSPAVHTPGMSSFPRASTRTRPRRRSAFARAYSWIDPTSVQ